MSFGYSSRLTIQDGKLDIGRIAKVFLRDMREARSGNYDRQVCFTEARTE